MYFGDCRRSGYRTNGSTVPPVTELPPPHPSWSPDNGEKQGVPYDQPFLDLDPEASTATPCSYMSAEASTSSVMYDSCITAAVLRGEYGVHMDQRCW